MYTTEESMIKKMKNNITIMYITGGLMWARFFVPVLALFYVASRVTIDQFAIIMAVFSLAILIFEIPSGVVADLMGKKNALIASRIMYVVEVLILAFGNGFWPFLIAKIISGIGVSLSSGTSEALMYDTLKKMDKDKDYKKVAGKASVITNVSTAIVFIIGAWMFSINPKFPAMASWPFLVLGVIFTFFLTEPYKNERKMTLNNSIKQLKESIKYFWKNNYLKFIGFLTLAVSTMISIALSLSSVYLTGILVPISLIGVVAFISRLIPAWSAKNAEKIDDKFGVKKTLLLAYVMTIVGIFLMAFMAPIVGILFFLMLPFVEGFYDVIVKHYINDKIPTSHRTTMLSINNSFDNVGIFIMFPIIGHLARFESLSTAFLVMFLIFIVYGLVLLYASRYVFGEKKKEATN